MPAALIKDFLLTQGLKLPLDEVRVVYLIGADGNEIWGRRSDRPFGFVAQ